MRSLRCMARVWGVASLLASSAAAQSLPAGDNPRTIARSEWPQPPEVISRVRGRITVRATRLSEPLRMDGRLDERAYQEVTPITGFLQQEPQTGAPITEKTEAWVFFDDTNIYFSCRCSADDPATIVGNDMRRDSPNLRLQDNFAVSLDTFHDGRNGYLFYVSPAGGMFDSIISDERGGNTDWNTVWDAKAGRFEWGWAAEIAIPFKSLRYSGGREQTWGIQLRRSMRTKNEQAYLTPVSPAWAFGAIFHFSVAANLVGLEAPPAARNFELKPYAIAGVVTDRLARPARSNEIDRDAGFDLKYGITKSMTADITYNTDFAQVEEDEAQVNLTRFNLSFPEKREFFLEGRGIFAFGGAPGMVAGGGGADAPAVFYSRQIGLSRGRPVPIIAGARVTGKAGKWNLGALNLLTDDEPAVGAQRTNFTVLSMRRDVLRRSAVGVMFTGRSVSTVAPGSNEVFGLDGQFQFYENVSLSTYVAKSRTQGLKGKDVHYRGQFIYNADRYGLELDRLVVGDNFNPEVGFMRRTKFRRSYAQARFSPRTSGRKAIRKYFFESSIEYTTDNSNRLESRDVLGSFRMELQSGDTFSLSHSTIYELIPQPFTIADGVQIPIGGYNFKTLRTGYNLGQQHRVNGSASLEVGSFYGGDKTTVTFRGRAAILPRLAVEPNISLNWIDLPQGEFTNRVVGGRLTYTMSPRMYTAALVQYASSNTSLSANIRFRWEYQPGSEMFIVYTEGRDTLPVRGTSLETRGFVVKFNRLFRF